MPKLIWRTKEKDYEIVCIDPKDMDAYYSQRSKDVGIPVYYSEDGRFWPFIDLPIES